MNTELKERGDDGMEVQSRPGGGGSFLRADPQAGCSALLTVLGLGLLSAPEKEAEVAPFPLLPPPRLP